MRGTRTGTPRSEPSDVGRADGPGADLEPNPPVPVGSPRARAPRSRGGSARADGPEEDVEPNPLVPVGAPRERAPRSCDGIERTVGAQRAVDSDRGMVTETPARRIAAGLNSEAVREYGDGSLKRLRDHGGNP